MNLALAFQCYVNTLSFKICRFVRYRITSIAATVDIPEVKHTQASLNLEIITRLSQTGPISQDPYVLFAYTIGMYIHLRIFELQFHCYLCKFLHIIRVFVALFIIITFSRFLHLTFGFHSSVLLSNKFFLADIKDIHILYDSEL